MIHYVSKFTPLWHTERHIADALEWHGQIVQCYELDNPTDRPTKVAAGDVVFTSVPQCLDTHWLAACKSQGAKLACWYFDWIWEYKGRDAAYLPRLKLMDAVFSTDGFDSSRYEAAGIGCREWLPQAAPQEERLVDIPPGTPAHDALFLGRLYNHDRQETIQSLRDAGINVGVYGVQTSGRRIWGRERQALIRSAKIVFGLSFRDDVPGYWSNRAYLTLSAGGFYLCRKVGGLDRVFTPGKHLATFAGSPVAAVKRWLKRDQARARIAAAGYRHVHANHTYVCRVSELIARLHKRGLL